MELLERGEAARNAFGLSTRNCALVEGRLRMHAKRLVVVGLRALSLSCLYAARAGLAPAMFVAVNSLAPLAAYSQSYYPAIGSYSNGICQGPQTQQCVRFFPASQDPTGNTRRQRWAIVAPLGEGVNIKYWAGQCLAGQYPNQHLSDDQTAKDVVYPHPTQAAPFLQFMRVCEGEDMFLFGTAVGGPAYGPDHNPCPSGGTYTIWNNANDDYRCVNPPSCPLFQVRDAQTGQCKQSNKNQGCSTDSVGNPCNPGTGTKFETQPIYRAGGVSTLAEDLRYNSRPLSDATSIWRGAYGNGHLSR